jgi:hypothetical protein
MDMNFASAARDVLAGRSHVVFDVAGAENTAGVDVFKAGKDFFGRSAGDVGDDVEASAMAHAHHKFGGAEAGAGIENFIDQRDQRGDAFERKALAAEITLLHDLLEDVGADEQVENASLIFFCDLETLRWRFHLLVNPAAAFGSVDVIDFDTDGRRVDGAGLAGVLAVDLQFGGGTGTEKAKGIEVAFEVSPLAEGVENTLALEVR